MNYRHAFHAGNFADCMKHALLVWLVRAMQRKAAGLAILDTHAGAGSYGPVLRGGAAHRGMAGRDRPAAGTVARSGDRRLSGAGVRDAGAPARYPGSPLLAQAMLRPQDRLIACELHPDEHATLRRTLDANDPRVSLHHRDGYAAIGALLPPTDGIRRGLVLIDPPFEDTREFERMEAAIRLARRRFNTAVVAAWYPIKHRAPVRALHDRLVDSGTPDLVTAELLLRPPLDPTRLNGCGLLVLAPPFGFEAAAASILSGLGWNLGGIQATESIRRLTPERIGP